MILPGRTILSRAIVGGLSSSTQQVQPCGIDLSVKHVLRWKSPGVVDFDNSLRKPAATEVLPFDGDDLHVALGAYLVQFNETVDIPNDLMGELFVRSSLFRSGASLHAGLVDSGYRGSLGE